MIKILRDVIGRNGTVITVPFVLENLPDKPMTPEVIIKTEDSNYVVRTDSIVRVVDDIEEPVTEITKEDNDGLFIVRLNLASINDAQSLYIRVYNIDTSSISPEIIIAKDSEATIQTRTIDLDFRPKTVKVIDSVICTANGAIVPFDASNFDIQVLVSNNSSSTNPIWEDMTAEYLNHEEFTMYNNQKDSDKLWSIGVKYVVQKHSTNSTIEISDIKLIVL